MAGNDSDLQAAQRAVDKISLPKGLHSEEVESLSEHAAQELVPFRNAAVSGETVVTGVPGGPAGPLPATILADGAETGVPEAAIGYVDAAGNFFSALIGGMSTSALILSGIVVVGIVVAVGAAIYYGYYGGLNSKQAEAVMDQVRDPNSEESLRGMRDATQTPAASPDATANTQPSNPRHEVQESQGTVKGAQSGVHGQDNPGLHGMVVGTWTNHDKNCGIDVPADVIRLSANGSALSGTLAVSFVKTVNDPTADPCEGAAKLNDPNPTETLTLKSVGFDGRILWFSFVWPPADLLPPPELQPKVEQKTIELRGEVSGNRIVLGATWEQMLFEKSQ